MFGIGKRWRVAKIGPFNINIAASWIISLVLVNLYFYSLLKTASAAIIASLLTFVCILIHELSHSIFANKLGYPVKDITLFWGGGVAEITKDVKKAVHELIISVVGPLSNILIAGLIYGAAMCLGWMEIAVSENIGKFIMAMIGVNIVLAGFNLLPVYPADGGRILRSFLWLILKNQIKATKIAFGVAVAVGVVGGGYLFLFKNSILAPFLVWWILYAGKQEMKGLIFKQKLETLKVKDVMKEFDDFYDSGKSYCKENDDLLTALKKMKNSNVDFLKVIDENKFIVGLIFLNDIVKIYYQ